MSEIDPPTPVVERDRYGRPLIAPPGGGRKVAYTRATTVAGTLDDRYNLELWKMRQVAAGLAARPDLVALACSQAGDKTVMNRICGDAMDASASGAAANLGTAVHGFVEQINRGIEPVSVPETVARDLAAYRKAMEAWDVLHAERFLVLDEYKIAGTADMIMVERDTGRTVIGDLKGLALGTELATPDGWTTMRAVSVGDTVFGSDGRPAAVIAKSRVKRIGTYVVKFDDGAQIVCDREHLWWTVSDHGECVIDVETLASTLSNPVTTQRQHRVPVARALDLPQAELPIDPYLLGVWLGDGSSRGGTVTKGCDLFEILEADGHALGVEQPCHSDKCVTRTVLGLTGKLRALNLLHNKHIPAAYLRASIPQRLALLQGLMDTDGTWNRPRRRAVFGSTNKQLALDATELMSSLGFRPHNTEVPSSGFGKTVLDHRVDIHPLDSNIFRLPRKRDASRDRTSSTRAMRRLVMSVEPGPNIETACIAVDSPNRTYLAGRRMIPTHNTGKGAITYGQGAIAAQLAIYSRGVIYHADTGDREPVTVDQDVAIVVHLPAGEGRCSLFEVDIAAGWQAVEHSMWTRDWRKQRNLFTPYTVAAHQAWEDETSPAAPKPARPPNWIGEAEAAPTVVELEAVYRAAVAAGADTSALIPVCAARKAELTAA